MTFTQTPCERIKQLRAQMLIHSRLYYWLADPIISDHVWQQRANELAELQKQHGDIIGWYDEAFADWTGSTGFDLPSDEWVTNKALYIKRLHYAKEL